MKKIITLAVAFVLIACQISFGQTTESYAEEETKAALSIGSEAQNSADKLNTLGLFKGTDKGYELDRTPTRTESIVMLVRLLGEESNAISQKYSHPFTDVPSWASSYVGYAYEKGLTKGLTASKFGATESATSAQYLTFILRALGYNESAGDFTYSQVIDKSVELGLVQLIEQQPLKKAFSRGDAAILSKRALESGLKGTETGDFATACTDRSLWNDTLINSLIKKGAVSKEAAAQEGLLFLEDITPAPVWMHYTATSDRTAKLTEDLISLFLTTGDSITDDQTYIRFNAGEWVNLDDVKFEDTRITYGKYFQNRHSRMTTGYENRLFIDNVTDTMIDMQVTFKIEGKTYKSMVYSYKTAPAGVYLKGFRSYGEDWGPSGGEGGESQDQQYLLSGTDGKNDDHIWRWYQADMLEGPYTLVEGANTYHYGYDGDEMFPIKQGKYFYYKATSAPDSTAHNGWVISGPYYYK